MKSKMQEINNSHELDKSINSNEAVLIYFYNDQCAPCIALRPKVEKMIEQEFNKMKLIFINAGQYPELSAGSGVYASPTIIAYFAGKESFRVSKYISIPELGERISRYYNLLFS